MTVSLKISLDEPYLVLPGEGLIVPTLSQDEMVQALSSIGQPSSSSLASSTLDTLSSYLSSSSLSSTSILSSNSTISSLVPPHLIVNSNSNDQASSNYTTPLTGYLTFQVTKPTRVLSNAKISLSGITHLALLGTSGKRSHTFQTHLDLSQLLPIQPPTLATALETGQENGEQFLLDDSSEEGEPILLLQPGMIKVPFILRIPNLSPPSVATPEGGTYYRLTAKVILPSSQFNLVHKLKTKLSIGSQSEGSAIETFSVLQIYRAPRSRCLYVQASAVLAEERAITAEAAATTTTDVSSTNVANGDVQQTSLRHDREAEAYDRELENNANDLVPITVHDVWPGHSESTVSIPFTQFLKESGPPVLHIQLSILNPEIIQVKSFQVTLWERAIYRVQKRKEEEVFEAAVVAGIVDPFASRKRYVIGIRERAVHAQRADASSWVPVRRDLRYASMDGSSPSGVPVIRYSKRFAFTVPDPSCTNERIKKQGGGRWGNTNSSTYTHVSKLKRVQRYEEDKEIKDEEFGRVHIEIQHFLRYTLFFAERIKSLDRKMKSMVFQKEDKERIVGQVPVILHGVPTGPESDRSGLPSYLTSLTSKEVSAENERCYEEEALGLMEGTLTNLSAVDDIISEAAVAFLTPEGNTLQSERHTETVGAENNQEVGEEQLPTPASLPSYTDSMNAERDQLSYAIESKQGYPGS